MESGAAVSAVRESLGRMPRGRWVLAVSGGRDSMVLFDAMVAVRPEEIAAVATFDHGTGPAARSACALAASEAKRLGIPAVTGHAPSGCPATEAHWRGVRHDFLAACARDEEASVVTAHTRDDQIETVVQRLLRDAGPRGLAGMLADASPGGTTRPLLTVPRAIVAAYADALRVPFVDDPSNASLRFQRNRVRHELLPALVAADPCFAEWSWAIGERAAAWRRSIELLVDRIGVTRPDPATLVIPAAMVEGLDASAWEVLWPAFAARAGVIMDRRGIDRAAAWAPRATSGQMIPLSGDARLERTAATFVVRGTSKVLSDYIY